jgi:hypothetical protein
MRWRRKHKNRKFDKKLVAYEKAGTDILASFITRWFERK